MLKERSAANVARNGVMPRCRKKTSKGFILATTLCFIFSKKK